MKAFKFTKEQRAQIDKALTEFHYFVAECAKKQLDKEDKQNEKSR